MRQKVRFAVIGMGAMLAACTASVGTDFDATKSASFVEGRTTRKEVLAALGKPTYSVALPDGREMLTYLQTTARPNTATYVPVVGLFAGKTVASTRTLTVILTVAGVLETIRDSESELTASFGVK